MFSIAEILTNVRKFWSFCHSLFNTELITICICLESKWLHKHFIFPVYCWFFFFLGFLLYTLTILWFKLLVTVECWRFVGLVTSSNSFPFILWTPNLIQSAFLHPFILQSLTKGTALITISSPSLPPFLGITNTIPFHPPSNFQKLIEILSWRFPNWTKHLTSLVK